MTIKKQMFTYDGRALEVRANLLGDTWHIAVFENGSPANRVVYQVTDEVVRDALSTVQLDCISSLMETARADFIRWSDFLKRKREQK